LPFRAELVRLAARLNLDPDGLSAVMSLESGYDPAAVNLDCLNRLKRPSSQCATGLIQFMPDTARRLGTTVDALRRMGDAEQLEYVEKFFRPFAGRLQTPGDFYIATFMPAHVGKDPGFVLFEEGESGYAQNSGLDRDRDGRITIGDVTAAIEARYAQGRARPPLEVDETIPLAGAGPTEAPAASDSSSLPLPALFWSESFARGLPVLRPVARRFVGSAPSAERGPAVLLWQLSIGAYPSGVYDGPTVDATAKFQATHSFAGLKLQVDRVVGPRTWGALLTEKVRAL
jgi:hypothetical protein